MKALLLCVVLVPLITFAANDEGSFFNAQFVVQDHPVPELGPPVFAKNVHIVSLPVHDKRSSLVLNAGLDDFPSLGINFQDRVDLFAGSKRDAPIWRGYNFTGFVGTAFTCENQFPRRRCVEIANWRLTEVLHTYNDIGDKFALRLFQVHGCCMDISTKLLHTHLSGHVDSGPSGAIGLPRQPESDEKQERAYSNEYCGIERVVPHVLRGGVHRLCGSVHSLLGSKVFYLPLAGFFFAALAGLGGGLVLDNVNPDRRRRLAGWVLLSLCLPIGAACLLLGLP